MTREEFFGLLGKLFPAGPWPKPLHLLQALAWVRAGQDPAPSARAAGTSMKALERVTTAPDAVREVLGIGLQDLDKPHRDKATLILGQMLLGRCAERAFEEIYASEMKTHDLELRDLRDSRTDTDYRLYNGLGRPVYRINIKFHGSLFRRASELVGLVPADCFALATYKIYSALQKQQQDELPYFFAIVSAPHLTAEAVGREIPTLWVEAVALLHQAPRAGGKRNFEDAVVSHLAAERHPVFEKTFQKVVGAAWYLLSARRADRLLRELLFERVYALRVPSFARAFRGAELDMHFALSRDLIPLRKFLQTLREHGAQRVTTLLERGDF